MDVIQPKSEQTKTFKWRMIDMGRTSEKTKHFQRLKLLLTKSPVLAFYDHCKSTIVGADASSSGVLELLCIKR